MTRTAARLNPDTKPALLVAVVLTSGLAAISFTLSFAGLSAIAPWAAVPPHLAWALPVFIDGAILVYTYAALAARARGEGQGRAWTWLTLWTAVSVASNGSHAWDAGPGGWQGVLGSILAGLFPVGVLLATHTIADLIVARPEDTVDVDTVEPAASEQPRGVPSLTDEQRAAIVELHAQGLSVRKVADVVGLSKSTVHNVTRHLEAVAS